MRETDETFTVLVMQPYDHYVSMFNYVHNHPLGYATRLGSIYARYTVSSETLGFENSAEGQSRSRQRLVYITYFFQFNN